MIELAYTMSQHTTFLATRQMWFFTSFLWSRVSALKLFCNGSDSAGSSNVVQSRKKVRQRPWQWLEKCSGKRAWAVHRKSKFTKTKKSRQVKSKVKGMLTIFFDIKGIVLKEFILAVNSGIFAYYYDILRWVIKNVRRLHPQLWRQKN
jgi:hypothetical protein